MDACIYNELHILTIEKTHVKMYYWTGNSKHMVLLGQNYHIPPLTMCLPFKKLTTNTFTLSGLIDLTNACIVTTPYVTEMRENIEINNSLYIEEEKCVNI